MNLYACDACNYLFASEDAIPGVCPACGLSTMIKGTDTSKKVTVPTIRPATEEEALAYKAVEETLTAERSFLDRVDNLGTYDLSDDEYHVALMLLFYFKSAPGYQVSKFLNDILPTKNSFAETHVAQAMARELYSEARRHFTSEIGKERSLVGVNDIRKVAAQMPEDSAARILRRFRQDEIDTLMGKEQTLGNVRRVDMDQVIREPGAEYRRFLLEWYNSIT